MDKISKEIMIEDLVAEVPESVTYLMEKGIRCIRCGEPIWGTMEEAAKEKGFNDESIDRFVEEINSIILKKEKARG